MTYGELDLKKIIDIFSEVDRGVALAIVDDNDEIINFTCIYNCDKNIDLQCTTSHGKPVLIAYDSFIDDGDIFFTFNRSLRKYDTLTLKLKGNKDDVIENLIDKTAEIREALNQLKEGDC